MRAQNAEQAKQIAELLRCIRELEARLAKDSHNASKPPSSDPPFKKPPPRTRRERGGKKPGGQKARRVRCADHGRPPTVRPDCRQWAGRTGMDIEDSGVIGRIHPRFTLVPKPRDCAIILRRLG
ncbi:MAG: hypothetical protein KFB96_06445 [Thiocapsa sp.]|nr:MAG: hypothetical protein KFB96_06445 [Thiocapsa sp.]